ncbi:hypothetical protein GCM10009750_14600 [Agromyces salentinus]|uniref:Uncharacterized protein n=1 Tax=Agromyces salentinus TaxID=269421 RepID=A0ABN2MLP3_9MICO
MSTMGRHARIAHGQVSVNRVHFVAADADDARAQFAAAMGRDRADRGLARATAAARESVRGLETGTPGKTLDAGLSR